MHLKTVCNSNLQTRKNTLKVTIGRK